VFTPKSNADGSGAGPFAPGGGIESIVLL